MDRRHFFTTIGAASTACLAGSDSNASEFNPDDDNVLGVLTDVTACIGCRKCEWACNDVNNLPVQSLESFEDKSVFKEKRRPDAGHYTIVNEYPGPEGSDNPLWVKFQCMHCNDPACYSACLVSAFTKNENGAVTYNADRCMGCRYCMVACPYQIPTYEYDVALNPKVQKCTLCFHRTSKEGGVPGCVEICPTQCMTFGKRKDVLEVAKSKIAENPDKYVDHVYGEHEVGGSSWVYISSKPFNEIGLPELPNESPPRLTESIQHGIFKNFIPQIGLFAALGTVATIFNSKQSSDDSSNRIQSTPQHTVLPKPTNSKFFTQGVWILIALAGVGLLFALTRFIAGLEAVTNLNNQYPWGIWIGIDVATGVALAAGGFTTSALVYLFHCKKYKPLVRPALLTAMLGYTFVVLGLLVDLGRYYNVWHPMLPSMWSGHSVLFEVGMCVMFYLTVLYIEFIPIVTERFIGHVNLPGRLSKWNKPVDSLLRFADHNLNRIMLFFIIAGVLLSCLHQSSLGSLMLIAPTKMHPLWFTPILPWLFLLSAFCVGFPMVIFESAIASKVFGRKPEMDLLTPISRYVLILLMAYLTFKVGDIAIREVSHTLFEGSVQSLFFIAEMVIGVIVPMVMLLYRRVRESFPLLFTSSALVVLGVALNRINVFITAYTPVYKVEPYFPSFGEICVTIGLISALVLVYRLLVIWLPVLPTEEKKHPTA